MDPSLYPGGRLPTQTVYTSATAPAPGPGSGSGAPSAPGAGPAPVVAGAIIVENRSSGADTVAKILLTIAVVLLTAAFVLAIIACVGKHWLERVEHQILVSHSGLWKYCSRYDTVKLCMDDQWDTLPTAYYAGINAVRAFLIIGLILSGFALVKFIMYWASKPMGYNRAMKHLYHSTRITIVLATLCYFIAFFVYLGITMRTYEVYQPGVGVVRIKAHCDRDCTYGSTFYTMMAAMILSQVAAWTLCYSYCFFMAKRYQESRHVV